MGYGIISLKHTCDKALARDVHMTVSKTKTVGKFNIIDTAKELWNNFMSWFD